MLARLVARVLEAPLAIESSPVERLDAIVVLGAPLARDGRLTEVLRERVEAAAALFHAGGAPLVVASGGVTHGAPRAEADALADGLRAAGVADVLVERESRTTVENARCVAALLRPRDARRVWLVTQPFHAKARSTRVPARRPRAADLAHRDERAVSRPTPRDEVARARVGIVGRADGST